MVHHTHSHSHHTTHPRHHLPLERYDSDYVIALAEHYDKIPSKHGCLRKPTCWEEAGWGMWGSDWTSWRRRMCAVSSMEGLGGGTHPRAYGRSRFCVSWARSQSWCSSTRPTSSSGRQRSATRTFDPSPCRHQEAQGTTERGSQKIRDSGRRPCRLRTSKSNKSRGLCDTVWTSMALQHSLPPTAISRRSYEEATLQDVRSHASTYAPTTSSWNPLCRLCQQQLTRSQNYRSMNGGCRSNKPLFTGVSLALPNLFHITHVDFHVANLAQLQYREGFRMHLPWWLTPSSPKRIAAFDRFARDHFLWNVAPLVFPKVPRETLGEDTARIANILKDLKSKNKYYMVIWSSVFILHDTCVYCILNLWLIFVDGLVMVAVTARWRFLLRQETLRGGKAPSEGWNPLGVHVERHWFSSTFHCYVCRLGLFDVFAF